MLLRFFTSKWLWVALFLITSFSLLGLGCSKRDSKNKNLITIKGSDTMVQLMSFWSEGFMKVNPGIEVSVTGGGSGTGIAALINGTTDICASSREMQDKEKKMAEEKKIAPKEFIVARDGLAVFVHPENPITELTMEQVRKIYTGTVKNWKDVGGPVQPIIALSRENSSGTYVFFQEHVLDKQDFAKEVRLMTSTSAIVQSVGDDEWSVGYGGIAYAHAGKVKIINIKKDENSPAVIPSAQTVLDASYPIARPLYLYFNGEPKEQLKTFLDFCLSSEGQKIVKEVGYITIK